MAANPVADVRPLTSLTALRRLNLDGAAPDVWELAALRGLRELSLRNNGLDDVSALTSMTGLDECWTSPTTASTT